MKGLLPKYNIPTLIVLLSAVLLSVYLFYNLNNLQQQLLDVEENRYHSYMLSIQINRNSEELTRLAHTYVITDDSKYEKQYRKILVIQNATLPLPETYDSTYWDYLASKTHVAPSESGNTPSLKQQVQSTGFSNEELLLLKKFQQQSDTLMALDKIAFNMMKGKFLDDNGVFSIIGKPDQQSAINMLHNAHYQQVQSTVMEPLYQFYKKLETRNQQQVDRAAENLKFAHNIHYLLIVTILLIISILIVTAKRHYKKLVSTLKQMVFEKTELQSAFDKLKTLGGIIPICSTCHRIRDEKGNWNQMESYISHRSEAQFSHGYCPTCVDDVRSEMGLEKN